MYSFDWRDTWRSAGGLNGLPHLFDVPLV